MDTEAETRKKLKAIEKRLGYSFRDKRLIVRALTHPSYAHEKAQALEHKNPAPEAEISHYERLEFLGDAVLDLVISHMLMEKFRNLLEGDLSRLRASLVNYERLAEIAIKLKLDKAMFLGRGEKATGGEKKPSILSAVYEAVVGAIYLDGGFGEAFRVVSGHYEKILKDTDGEPLRRDYKTEIQEKIQAKYKKVPIYRVAGEKGPQHSKTFEVELRLGSKVLGRGKGRSKKEAEQEAAKQALKKARY